MKSTARESTTYKTFLNYTPQRKGWVFELASGRVGPSFHSTWQAGGFGALYAVHLLDPLVLSRDAPRIDSFCFLYNAKRKIHVFITGLQVLQGFETLSALS